MKQDDILLEKKLLKQEGDWLYACLFNKKAKDEILENYYKAHVSLKDMRDFSVQKLETINKIVTKKLDAIAIEPWLRTKTKAHPLSAKLTLLSYLEEAYGKKGNFSRNTKNLLMPWHHIMVITFLSFFKLAKGLIIKKIYGII